MSNKYSMVITSWQCACLGQQKQFRLSLCAPRAMRRRCTVKDRIIIARCFMRAVSISLFNGENKGESVSTAPWAVKWG